MAKKLEQAQTLLFVMFLLIIAGTLVAALATMLKSETLTRSSGKDALTAFYLAQAGLERGKIFSMTYNGALPYLSGNFSDFSPGIYNYSVSFVGPDIRNISSAAEVLDNGRIKAQRRLSVQVSGFNLGSNFVQVPGTWQEN